MTFTNCCGCGAGVMIAGGNDGAADGAMVFGGSVTTIGEALGVNDGSIDG